MEEGAACVGPFDPNVLPSRESPQPRGLVTGPPREAGEQSEAKGRDQGTGFRARRGRPCDTRRRVTQAVLFQHGGRKCPQARRACVRQRLHGVTGFRSCPHMENK